MTFPPLVAALLLVARHLAGAPSSLDDLDPRNIVDEFRLANQPSEVVAIVHAHTRGVAALAFAPDGKALLSSGWDNTLQFYRIGRGQLRKNATLAGGAGTIVFAADGKRFYAGGADAYLHVWDTDGARLQEQPKMPGHKNRPVALALAPDGKLLASGCSEPVLRIWKVGAQGPEIWGILVNETVPTLGIAALAFDFEGKHLAASHHAGTNTLRIWNVGGPSMDELEFPKTQARLVAFSGKEPLLAFSADESIRLWEIKENKAHAKMRLAGHPQKKPPGAVTALAFSPDGQWLASTGLDRKVVLWDVHAGTKLREWLFAAEPRTLAFAPDGRHLAIGDSAGAILIVRLRSAKMTGAEAIPVRARDLTWAAPLDKINLFPSAGTVAGTVFRQVHDDFSSRAAQHFVFQTIPDGDRFADAVAAGAGLAVRICLDRLGEWASGATCRSEIPMLHRRD